MPDMLWSDLVDEEMVKCHFTSVLYSSLFYSISAAAALDKSAAAQLDLRCGAHLVGFVP